jgi:glycosyltransferase involved in cell wall biosynthesis
MIIKYKILLCLLTYQRVDKLKRLVKSVENLEPHPLIEIEPLIVVNTLNDEHYEEVLKANFPFKVIRTESNGKPGKGKNSCRKIFLESDADFLSQIDGDDWLYPTYAKSMAQHIEHYPNLDAVGLYPLDIVDHMQRGGYHFTVGDNDEYWGSVWGVSLFKKEDHGPGKGHWVDHEHPTNFDRLLLQSKLSAVEMMDEDIPNGEDHLYSIQLLKLHQDRKIRYFITMSSDLYITDTTLETSIQIEYPFLEHVKTMKDEMLKVVKPYRSSQEELPIIFNELLLFQQDKAAFIKESFNWGKS